MKDLDRKYRIRAGERDSGRPALPDLVMPAMPPMGLIVAIQKRFDERRQRQRWRHLLDYDEHTLADMGYCRHELVWALRLPLSVNAARALQQCRRQRPAPCSC